MENDKVSSIITAFSNKRCVLIGSAFLFFFSMISLAALRGVKYGGLNIAPSPVIFLLGMTGIPLSIAVIFIMIAIRRKVLVNLGRRHPETLIAALKNEKDVVRKNAAWALGELKEVRAAWHLKNLLGDGSKSVRSVAEKALSKIDPEWTITGSPDRAKTKGPAGEADDNEPEEQREKCFNKWGAGTAVYGLFYIIVFGILNYGIGSQAFYMAGMAAGAVLAVTGTLFLAAADRVFFIMIGAELMLIGAFILISGFGNILSIKFLQYSICAAAHFYLGMTAFKNYRLNKHH